MMVPGVHTLVEQVHLDVDWCLCVATIRGSTSALVPGGVRLDLALCAG